MPSAKDVLPKEVLRRKRLVISYAYFLRLADKSLTAMSYITISVELLPTHNLGLG